MWRFLVSVRAFCLINLWAGAAGQATVLTWTAGSRDFQFSMDIFSEFIECACRDDTRNCLVYAGSNNKVSFINRGTLTADQMQQETYTNLYSCDRSSSSFIFCERVITTSCDNVSGCWSYEITGGGSCALGQVVLTWVGSDTFSQEDNDVTDGLTIISSCSRPCTTKSTTGPTTAVPRQSTQSSTTKTTDSTTIASTTTTITSRQSIVKSTTTITSLSSTSSTTGGGGNTSQEEYDSDDTGIIVGVVIAVLVVIAALFVGGIFWWRRRKNAEKADRSLGNNVTGVHTSAFGISNSDNSGENTNSLTPYENVLGTGRPSLDDLGSSTPSYKNVLGDGRQSSENVDSHNKNSENTNSFTPYENVLGDGRQFSENVDSLQQKQR